MDSPDVHIALVLPSKQGYETAATLLDETYLQYEPTIPGAASERTLGRVGPHNVILTCIPDSTADISFQVRSCIDDLLRDYPEIRAGILVGADAVAPEGGHAGPGDIVLGVPRAGQAAIVQFDAEETNKKKQLATVGQPSPPPRAVLSAVHELSASTGRLEWNQTFHKLGIPGRCPKVYRGKVASSRDSLTDSDLLNDLGDRNNISSFERSAGSLKSHLPFMVICGIADITNPLQAGHLAAVYSMFFISKLNPAAIAAEHSFTTFFEYAPFDLELPGFRLLQLLKGTGPMIECSVFQAYLDDDQLIPYHAISYAWGGQDFPETVTMDGRIIAITTSLHDALLHLRHPDQDRILWVDQLCIDQSNVKERGHQVVHMGEIYGKAEMVIFWLGFVDMEAELLSMAITKLRPELPTSAFRSWSYDDPRWKRAWKEVENTLTTSTKQSLCVGLEGLLKKDWFSRVWVLQEVAKARHAEVQHSRGSIPAKFFALLPRLLDVRPSSQCQAVLDIMPGPSKRSSWWSQERNLCTLLWKFRGCEATDPRDRVYALLGIASDMTGAEISADYSQSERAVVQQTVCYIFGEDPAKVDKHLQDVKSFQTELPTLSSKFLQSVMGEDSTEVETMIVESFLRRQGTIESSGYGITSNTIRNAFRHSLQTLQLLFAKYEPLPTPNTDLIIEAIKARSSRRLKVLIDHVEITEVITMAAIDAGEDQMRVLLEATKSKVQITEAVLQKAGIQNAAIHRLLMKRQNEEENVPGDEALQLMQDWPRRGGLRELRDLLNTPGRNLQITEEIIKEAIAQQSSEILEILFNKRGSEIHVTEAIEDYMMLRDKFPTCRLLFQERGNEIRDPEKVLRMIIKDAVQANKDNLGKKSPSKDALRKNVSRHDIFTMRDRTLMRRALMEDVNRGSTGLSGGVWESPKNYRLEDLRFLFHACPKFPVFAAVTTSVLEEAVQDPGILRDVLDARRSSVDRTRQRITSDHGVITMEVVTAAKNSPKPAEALGWLSEAGARDEDIMTTDVRKELHSLQSSSFVSVGLFQVSMT